MNISQQEKIMYEIMEALQDSGIPVDFKGSMVLKACLYESGFKDVRHTFDIDANWISETPPTSKQIEESIQNALTQKRTSS